MRHVKCLLATILTKRNPTKSSATPQKAKEDNCEGH